MPCIFDIKPEDRHCQYCTATICDVRQPKPVETLTTNKLNSMTDKEKIRAEIERLQDGLMDAQGRFRTNAAESAYHILCHLENFINFMQEEPVSEQNLSNVERTVKNWKEEPVSEDLEDEIARYFIDKFGFQRHGEVLEIDNLSIHVEDLLHIARHFANWQKEQDKQWLAEEHKNIFSKGRESMREQMMKHTVDVTVHIEAGNYPYIPQIELYDYENDIPLAKEGDKYKVILIKGD